MKISDMVISAIIKRGILYEARNCDIQFDIPLAEKEEKIKVTFRADNMTLKIEKDEVK
jgi:hypothetical protein